MMTSSILVVTDTTESVEFRLIQLLGGNDPTSSFVLTCEDCISTANAPRLLQTVLDYPPAWNVLFQLDCQNTSRIFDGKVISDGESLGVFTLLVSLLDRISDPIESSLFGRKLAIVIESYTGRETDDIETYKKILFLSYLFNQRTSAKDKCWFLGRIFYIAGHSSVEEVQLSLLPGHETLFGKMLECSHLTGLIENEFIRNKDQEGGLDSDDMRLLFHLAAEAMGYVVDLCKSKAENMNKKMLLAVKHRQIYLLKILNTYSEISQVDEVAIIAAKNAAIGAIRDPLTLYTEQNGMMVFPPIMSLKSDPVTSSLYILLKIFQEGKLEDFHSFVSQNGSTLSSLNLNTIDCTRNIRLLSLCSLSSEYDEISYDVIMDTLQVSHHEVENWVFAAVSSGLISAKIDQLKQVVIVERCTVRRFGPQQWKVLQNQLCSWKKTVNSVINVLKQQ